VRISTPGKILAITALLLLASLNRANEAAAQSVFDLAATEVTIFSPESEKIIGHGHYKLSHLDGFDVVEGENKYLDGEYDSEEQRVRPSVGGQPPVLVSYQHQFFNPDGTTEYADSLDARTGAAICKRYDSEVPDIREDNLKIPPDTYAGAAQLMMLVGRLREGAAVVSFHSFNCVPDPKIFSIKATPVTGPVTWPMYPGKLVKMEMKPDFGWLNVLIAPFIPRIYGWFDPTDSFNYVGGQFDRYYKGRHILMVRAHDANPVAEGAARLPTDH
jgi:hypothetical protein